MDYFEAEKIDDEIDWLNDRREELKLLMTLRNISGRIFYGSVDLWGSLGMVDRLTAAAFTTAPTPCRRGRRPHDWCPRTRDHIVDVRVIAELRPTITPQLSADSMERRHAFPILPGFFRTAGDFTDWSRRNAMVDTVSDDRLWVVKDKSTPSNSKDWLMLIFRPPSMCL